MRKSIITAILLFVAFYANAQDITVRQANLERMNFKTGIMILYYGENRMIGECSLWDVKFKKEVSEEEIANKIKARRAAYHPYMYFEFKAGYDCNSADGYLRKKGINKNIISSCINIDFSANADGAMVQPGNGTNAWNDPSRVTTEKVDQLDTYAWALVNKQLEKRQKELEAAGWQRVYTEYNLAGGPDNKRWVGKRVSVSTDSMYKTIGTVVHSSFRLKVLNLDKTDAEGNATFVYENEFAESKLGETVSFRPKENITKFIFAGASNDRVNTNPAGIIIYRKKYNIQDEFQGVLDDAKNNFINYKLDETKDPNGVPVFNATPLFGLKKQMIFKTQPENKWMYCQFCNTDDPNAETIKKEITNLIDSYVSTGNFLTESGEYEGNMIYRLMDKQKNILFQMGVGDKKISLNFFGSRDTLSNEKNIGKTQPTDAKKEGNNSNPPLTVQQPFINPNKDYIFQNWNWAKITFKWSWLETPASDGNVSREFLDFSNKPGNDKDDIILRIHQKTDGYTWAMATPNVGKFATYTYAAIMGLAKAQGSEFGQGLMILFKDGRKGDFSRLYFLIDPTKQTYWFGSQNPNTGKWETHNHYTGNTYNIFSAAINKYIDDGNTITKNSIAIEKQADKFLLYINNQLVDTVELNKKNDVLNNFEGIGIVTVDKQISSVDKLSFSR